MIFKMQEKNKAFKVQRSRDFVPVICLLFQIIEIIRKSDRNADDIR